MSTPNSDSNRMARYAVIMLDPNCDIAELFNTLISCGHTNVTFVNSLSEHIDMQKARNGIDDRPISPAGSSNSIRLPPQPFIPQTTRDESSEITLEADKSVASPSRSPSPPAEPDPLALLSSITSTNLSPRGVRTVKTLTSDDDGYINCKLCDNKLMCSRISNLTNHVRRHSPAKQYQCVHCTYQHNEQAKVRMHMSHQHNDMSSQPLDCLTPQMQRDWTLLMNACFPGYMANFRQIKNQSAFDDDGDNTLDSSETGMEHGDQDLDCIHNCIECGMAVITSRDAVVSTLGAHILENHEKDCIPFACDQCGYMNAAEEKVQQHVQLRHPDSEGKVSPGNAGDNISLFISKYFPSASYIPEIMDDEDQQLSSLQNENQKPSEDSFNDEMDQSRSVVEEENDYFDPETDEELPLNKTHCTICGKILELNVDNVALIINHCKQHSAIKQFECNKCEYASNDVSDVRTHLLLTHGSTEKPIEHNNPVIQETWTQIMMKCFPDVTAKMDRLRVMASKKRKIYDVSLFSNSKRIRR